jgi:hypothetical protein
MVRCERMAEFYKLFRADCSLIDANFIPSNGTRSRAALHGTNIKINYLD